jgi:hypothetical protein
MKHRHRTLSKQVAAVIDSLMSRLSETTWEDFVCRAMEAETELLRRPNEDPLVTLEIQRRCAELLFEVALLKRAPREECSRRFLTLQRLGFTDLERRLEKTFLYANLSVSAGYCSEALNAMESLLGDLQRADPSPGERAVRRTEGALSTLRERILRLRPAGPGD